MDPNQENKVRRFVLLAALTACAVAFAALAIKARLDDQDRQMGLNALPQTVAAAAPLPSASALPDGPSPAADRPDASGDKAEAGDDMEYTVRAHQGYMAVFRPGNAAPVEITDTRIASLRRADQMLLREGITVRGGEALARLLEDFSN